MSALSLLPCRHRPSRLECRVHYVSFSSNLLAGAQVLASARMRSLAAPTPAAVRPGTLPWLLLPSSQVSSPSCADSSSLSGAYSTPRTLDTNSVSYNVVRPGTARNDVNWPVDQHLHGRGQRRCQSLCIVAVDSLRFELLQRGRQGCGKCQSRCPRCFDRGRV